MDLCRGICWSHQLNARQAHTLERLEALGIKTNKNQPQGLEASWQAGQVKHVTHVSVPVLVCQAQAGQASKAVILELVFSE